MAKIQTFKLNSGNSIRNLKKRVFVETFVQNSMPSKSVKKAKLYLVSVKLCTPYATPNISLFKLGNSELWRSVIPYPVVGSRSVIHVNNISKTHSSMFFT